MDVSPTDRVDAFITTPLWILYQSSSDAAANIIHAIHVTKKPKTIRLEHGKKRPVTRRQFSVVFAELNYPSTNTLLAGINVQTARRHSILAARNIIICILKQP